MEEGGQVVYTENTVRTERSSIMTDEQDIVETCCKQTCCANGCCSDNCNTGECSTSCCSNGCCSESVDCCTE